MGRRRTTSMATTAYDAEVGGRSIRVVTSADNLLFVITAYLLTEDS